MSYNTSGREIATKITVFDNGIERTEQLTHIGSGTTALVYRTESGDIVKEFYPKINGKQVMSRKEGGNSPATPLEVLSAEDKDILEQRRAAFYSEFAVIDELNGRYRDENDNMFLVPRDMPLTSLGRCHWCNYVGGRTAQAVFEQSRENSRDFYHHFLTILPFVISLYDEIAFYHENGVLNLDIKPENLLVIKSQGSYIGIRNLDFGSVRRLNDKMKEGQCVEPGLVRSLREYAAQNSRGSKELLIDELAARFFACTPAFYDTDRITSVIDRCLEADGDESDILSDLRQLDILAAWKTFLCAMGGADELLIPAEDDIFEGEQFKVNRIFEDVFANKTITGNRSLFASYHIYRQLHEIMGRSFASKRRFRLTASEIADRLRLILCMLNGIPDNQKTQEQRDAEMMVRVFAHKDQLLEANGLRSIRAVCDFCEGHGLKRVEKAATLYQMLSRAAQNVNFRLFPDIVTHDGDVYSHYDEACGRMREDADVPLLRAYRDVQQHKKIILLGKASLGKSTSLRVFEAEMLSHDIPCLLYECRSINAKDISDIQTAAVRNPNAVFVFDAYDELPQNIHSEFDNLVEYLDQFDVRALISSRSATETEDRIFQSYYPLFVGDFTMKQLDSLVSREISRSSGYFSLLRNTMFLVLHLELETHDLLGKLSLSIKTEAEFIGQYFELLYLDKKSDEILLSDFIHLGEFLHKQRCEKNNRYIERIPNPVKQIFKYEMLESTPFGAKQELSSHQVKYLNYLHGLYLKEKLLEIYEESDRLEDLEILLCRFMNIPSTADVSESLCYAGQLLFHSPQAKQIFIALNSWELKKRIRYENVLCLFLGYNHDVADDIEDVFEFYHPVMRNYYHNYLYACDRIRVLKASSIQEIYFTHDGLTQLERIEINNDVFYSEGNCLIQKNGRGVCLGCRNSEIPEGVTYIHRHAFSHCNIQKVLIPDSVAQIDEQAFKYCTALEYVQIGKGVTIINPNAFVKCSQLKTLYIKNNEMEVTGKRYHLNAFSDCPIETAIVPTTAVAYVFKIAAPTLKSLDIYQGEKQSSPYALTFEGPKDDVRKAKQLRELTIRSDVRYIAEDAFVSFRNCLEKITVEPGNPVYRSEDNCLIAVQEEALILGCKNSVIPHKDVKTLALSAFSFCVDLCSIEIPSNITRIGKNCFNRCERLEQVSFCGSHVEIGDASFTKCKAIKRVMIPCMEDWLTYRFVSSSSNPLFYSGDFYVDGVKTETLVLPEVETICQGAFNNAKGIKQVVVPATIKKIESFAFAECKNLKSVHICDLKAWCGMELLSYASNPLTNGAKLYLNGLAISHLTIGKEIPIIKQAVFMKCSGLIDATIEAEHITIQDDAFWKCPDLTTVTLGGTDYEIGDYAFREGRVTVIYPGTVEEWAARYSSLVGVQRAVCADGEYTYHH